MNKRKINFYILLIIVILCMFFISGCQNMMTFSGTCVSTGKKFLLDFKYLNTTYESWMDLEEDDRVKTEIMIEEGIVDIYVKKPDGDIVYQGNDVDSCDFILEIKESGRYHLMVIGNKASGSVHFNKLP